MEEYWYNNNISIPSGNPTWLAGKFHTSVGL
jgi:hypothetical protein